MYKGKGWVTDCHGKSMESSVGTKSLVFCSSYNTLTLFLNLQNRCLACRERGILQTTTKTKSQTV